MQQQRQKRRKGRAIAKTLGVFRHRPFQLFWIGAFVSNIGNWTENAAQSWAVTTQTAGDPHQGLYVEILQFADFCPVLLLALIAGVISDRVNRRTWLIILQTTACLLGAALAVAAVLGKATPVVVIAFTFLEGIVWALNGPVFPRRGAASRPARGVAPRARAQFRAVQPRAAVRPDARRGGHRDRGPGRRLCPERLHLSPAAAR